MPTNLRSHHSRRGESLVVQAVSPSGWCLSALPASPLLATRSSTLLVPSLGTVLSVETTCSSSSVGRRHLGHPRSKRLSVQYEHAKLRNLILRPQTARGCGGDLVRREVGELLRVADLPASVLAMTASEQLAIQVQLPYSFQSAAMRAALLPLSLALGLLTLPGCPPLVSGANAADWSSRAIYQLLTDRFAHTQTNYTAPCEDWHDYCGGTFEGIVQRLDYIQALGFDAIWISPVIVNQPGAYHGYAGKNLYEINPHFGGPAGLLKLSDALHQRGMFLMVDVVANHVGVVSPIGNYTGVVPFDSPFHYHSCAQCPSASPEGGQCWIQDWTNRVQIEECQLAGLPDLNQTNPYVHETLLEWIGSLVSNYSIDGLRIDTVPEVPLDFWREFQDAAGVYAVGEVFNGNVSWVASYQRDPSNPEQVGALDALLSYPMFFTLRSTFALPSSPGGGAPSMTALSELLATYASDFPAPQLLGSFLENHDNPRFLNSTANNNLQLYKSAWLFNVLANGVPIHYYGGEIKLHGGNDPYCREPMWTYGFRQNGKLFEWMQTVMHFRSMQEVWKEQMQEIIVDDSVYAFSRAGAFIALTNDVSGAPQSRTIPGASSPFPFGEIICTIFDPQQDCVQTSPEDGTWEIVLEGGEQKVFVPQSRTRELQARLKEIRARSAEKENELGEAMQLVDEVEMDSLLSE
jgi:alpha-amylase